MKKNILFLLIFLTNISIANANANKPIKAHVNTVCSQTKNIVSSLSIKIDSNLFNLTENAIQDNLGGYVDIPEDKYYLKTDNKVYHLSGVVEKKYEDNINQFTSVINKDSNKLIRIDELYTLKDTKSIKLIQKINLENSTETKTNILNIYFDSVLFTAEYQKCKNRTLQTQETTYTKTLFIAFFILLILYILKK